MKYRWYIVLILIAVLLSGCGNTAAVTASDSTANPSEIIEPEATAASDKGAPQTAATEPKETIPQETTPKIQTITISATGDILCSYNCLLWTKNGDTYNFDPPFSEVMPYIQSSDLAIANLETVTAGPGAGYTGMPMFNSPDTLLDTIKKAGYDVIITANNHCADRGSDGITRTIDQLDARGILHTGTYKTSEESERILITDVKGVKVAILAYTESINYSYKQPCVVNRARMDKMQNDIKKARESGADVVVVHLHAGVEYARQPNNWQINTSHNLIKAGADIVLSEHPHVLQPMERITVADDSGETRDGLIFYSLGNFINQGGDIYKNIDGIFNITLEKDLETGKISIKGTEMIPTWLQIYRKDNGKGDYRVMPVSAAYEKYENKTDKYITEKDYNLLKKMVPQIVDSVNKGPVK